MKINRISTIIIFGLLMGTSCEAYEPYMTDYKFSAVYFGTQKPLRTIVAYEEMSFKVGVALSGKRDNTIDEWVTFSIDTSLLDATGFTLLPESYYDISDKERMIIPKGEFIGDVTVTLDRDLFTTDPLAHLNTYALPLRLHETSADSILRGEFDPAGNPLTPPKDYTVLVVKYISPLHGIYYHKGVERELDDSGAIVNEKAYAMKDLSKNETWSLSTLGLDAVSTSGAGTFNNGLTLTRNADNSVIIEAAGTAITVFEGNGTYNEEKRAFYLDYKFSKEGTDYHVTDTLILRQAPEKDLRFEEW